MDLFFCEYLCSVRENGPDILRSDPVLCSELLDRHSRCKLCEDQVDRHTRASDYRFTESHLFVDDDSRRNLRHIHSCISRRVRGVNLLCALSLAGCARLESPASCCPMSALVAPREVSQ